MSTAVIELPQSVGGLSSAVSSHPLPVMVDQLPIMALVPVFLLLAYLMGSIPFGLLLTRAFGYGDVRDIGSGNIGATNVMRTGNKPLAILTLMLDGIKGFIPVYAVCLFLWIPDRIADERITLSFSLVQAIVGYVTILGHVFPVWLRFKGGKGVATALGTLFALDPLLAFCAVALWIVTFLFCRISSLSALIAFAGTTIVAAGPAFTGMHHVFVYFIYTLVVTLLIFSTHRKNIAMLAENAEHNWSSKK